MFFQSAKSITTKRFSRFCLACYWCWVSMLVLLLPLQLLIVVIAVMPLVSGQSSLRMQWSQSSQNAHTEALFADTDSAQAAVACCWCCRWVTIVFSLAGGQMHFAHFGNYFLTALWLFDHLDADGGWSSFDAAIDIACYC